jgi:CRP-like cAMP-binding protein
LGELRAVTVFAGVDEAALDRIEARSRSLDVKDGAQIFSQGDAADSVYAITGGANVRIGTMGRGNKSLMVEVFGVGEIFGEIGVIDGGIRSADAFADGRVRLLRISSAVFLAALGEHAALGGNLCRLLAARLRRTFTLVEDATFESVETRLARQILYLARRNGRRTAQGLVLAGRFRQGDLADLLGTTNRSIITILNAWRISGLVAYDANRAQLTVTDETKLHAMISSTDDNA